MKKAAYMTGAELLRSTVNFMNIRSEHDNHNNDNPKTAAELIQEYVRYNEEIAGAPEPRELARTKIIVSASSLKVEKRAKPIWQGKPFLPLVEFRDLTKANLKNRCQDDAWGNLRVEAGEDGVIIQLRAHQVIDVLGSKTVAGAKHMVATATLEADTIENLIPFLRDYANQYNRTK